MPTFSITTHSLVITSKTSPANTITMNKPILVLFLTLSIISLLGWVNSGPTTQDPVGMFCNAVPTNANLAPLVSNIPQYGLNIIKETQKFKLSVKYFEANIQSMTSSTASCTSFFNGLKREFDKDIKSQGLTIQDTKEPFKQFLNVIFPDIPFFH
ncbi:unnamed protein product [Rotaria sordida]|uniref:Uncharacterized protein n=1 Tax=Rotaria sordida TaxID=392033 RepID=A0A814UG00_9BILA|nr:unnamed protein product [Rotaria sordida]CAF1063152.1 unnamed protein product [Rotaria sordida]CAF1174192.1 unnamed protein product [Rotaria sordida]CAF1174816.1 unnamed protein product [Rotaria sordida]